MDTAIVPETVAAVKSPFQLFSAFTEADKDKFFGREKETALLYQSVQEANVILVYGESGTGKTSIVQCGLLNETKHFNWSGITIRRIDDINASLRQQLNNAIQDETAKRKELGVTELMDEVFMSNFQPILLVFDQFEEIFVYGNVQERLQLTENISLISAMRIPWKMVFVIREDFLAQLDEFEKELPGLFKKRLRIELMDKSNCREVVVKSCGYFNIELLPLRHNATGVADMLYNEAAPDTPDTIINTVTDTRNAIHLPYFQVFLDRLWKEAWKQDATHIKMDEGLVQKVGDMGDVLKGFLEEKVNAQTIISPVDAWRFLKLFVPEKEKGTTRKKVNLKEYSAIPEATLVKIVDYFAEYKILTGCAVNSYELAHESLVPIIQNRKGNEIRTRLAVPSITGNPYKGLASFNEDDSYRFYGRKEAVKTVYDKVKQQDFVVIVGNSGTGKSSLIKAGLFPLLIADGYIILPVVKAGDSPVTALNCSYAEVQQDAEHTKFILLIDQYEELNTRISQNQTREEVYNWIAQLLEKQKTDRSGIIIKIIVTIRADFEPQFSVKPQLAQYWKSGKYIIPPFTHEEIREVIEEPAYQAGLEFSPPSLVESIADEVYSSQSTGLLPLMSFTLKELYNKYIERGKQDNLLLEEDYLALGGVIGGLQNRAQHIYDRFEKEHPDNYGKYQTVMQHLILRMIYLSTGEIAGQRVLKENLVYKDDDINRIKEEILNNLISSDLIVTRINNKEQECYEPAHDVFIRSWGQIWDWINVAGKDKLSLRSRLAQAVEEYYSNGQKPELLWDNKLTDGLLAEMQSDNPWLNKKEYDFVALSLKKREEAVAMLRRIEEDKIIAQKNKLRASRAFVAVTLALLGVAIAMFIWANTERKGANKALAEAKRYSTQANYNYKLATDANAKNIILNHSLADTNKTLMAKREELQQKADALQLRAEELRKQTIYAKTEALKALKAELKEKIAADKEREQRKTAEKAVDVAREATNKATQLTISLQEQKDSAEAAKIRAEKLLQDLVKTNASRDSAKLALDIQKKQNTAQLVSQSKRLELTDMVKAYRVAERAHQKDTADSAATGQYSKLLNQPAYFYTKKINGNVSKYSPDGNYILNRGFTEYGYSGSPLVEIIRNDLPDVSANSTTFTGLDGLVSADFTPISQCVLLTYKNRIEFAPLNNLKERKTLKTKEKDIVAARYSPDEESLLVITESHFSLYGNDVNGELTNKISSEGFGNKEKINNAVFSTDGKRVIVSSEGGSVAIWDVLTGKKLLDVPLLKNVLNTSLSPNGGYFITATPDALYLYDSQGRQMDKKDTRDKYGIIRTATFSPDGKQVVLSFALTTFSKEQANYPKKDNNNISLLLMRASRNKEIELTDITHKIPPEDLVQFAGFTPNTTINGDLLLYGFSDGLVKSVNVKTGVTRLLTGHSKPVNTISVLNGGEYIMTSAADNTTRVWRYDTPKNLSAAGLLPKLSDEDLNSFGVKN